MGGIVHVSLAFITLLCCVHQWYDRTRLAVPCPYLDEVFHVRQAQAYWAGNWTTWDPKITTPPGLYAFTYAFNWGLALLLPRWDGHNVQSMRVFNTFLLTFWLFYRVWTLIRCSERGNTSVYTGRPVEDENSAHATLNICLFPVIFFFSSLYYTDILSVCTVLEATYWHTRQARSDNTFSVNNFYLLLSGLVSLTVRQTNIFWVSIYLGGLQVTHHLASVELEHTDLRNGLKVAWTQGRFHNRPVANATLEDYILTIFTLPLAITRSLLTLLPTLWPHLTFLLTFITFVLLNGSVVLGDKSNHVASLHLPQLLYLWPYILFFSWPLILPQFITLLPHPRRTLPRLSILATFATLAALAVHYNTLLHPFLLADNRHYPFYIFRILRLHPSLYYISIPIYILSGILALAALSGRPSTPNSSTSQNSSGVKTSWVLIWLASTALSLVTAPLIEPRYVILPWLLWRLHVPHYSRPSRSLPVEPTKSKAQAGATGKLSLEEVWDYDHRLLLETLWHVVVNVVTGYVFLYRGFAWEQEPRNVQRFMW